MKKKILILTDGKAGHENQSKAFARALGFAFDLLPVAFRSASAKSLSYPLDRLGLRTRALFRTTPPVSTLSKDAYAAVIGTGSGTFYAAKTLARRLGVRCGVVLYPRGYDLTSFDCILAPAFDRPNARPNVVRIPANLVAVDAAFYAAGTKAFLERHTPAAHKRAVAVVVGGPNKCATMSARWMNAQLDRIFRVHKGAEFWVTTSRRTPPDVEAVVDSFPFDYKLLYSKDHFNPIPAFVSLAKTLYVTAESTGMISEACTHGGAEVRVLDNLKPGPHKFRRFIDDLAAGGFLNGSRKISLTAQFAHAAELLHLDQA